MIYLSSVLFLVGVVLVFRSIFGYEELKSSSMLDRVILAMLWLNITMDFLKDITKYMGN